MLSPKCFELYIDDLSKSLCNSNFGCQLDNVSLNHLFYADDMCLLAPSAIGLQGLINICESYGLEHNIIYNNPVKSKCLTILPARYRLSIPTVSLNGIPFEYAKSIKCLGIVISTTFMDDKDIARQLRTLYASANMLLSKFYCCTRTVKVQLLESYCLNFYCSTLWCEYTNHVFHKMKVGYNNVFRKLLGYVRRDSASAMFFNNQIDTFDTRFRKVCYMFRQRVLACSNKIIQCLTSNSWIRHNYMWSKWDNVLYMCNNF